MTSLLVTQASLKPDSTAWFTSIQLNAIAFPKHSDCASDYLSTIVSSNCLEEVRLTTQNHFKTILYLNSSVLVLLWSLEGKGHFQGRILSYSDSDSPGFSALICSVPAAHVLYLPGKYRTHKKKNSCGTSENLAPRDIGSTMTAVLSLLGTGLESLPSREIKSKGQIWKLIQILIKCGLVVLSCARVSCTQWPVGYKIPPGSYYTVFFISENQGTLWRRSTTFNQWESWG